MCYLIDYEGFGKTLLKDVGIPRANFISLGNLGALDKKEGTPFKLDLQKAKELLTEAGYPDGFEVNIFAGTTPYPFALPIAQSIQNNAEKIGVHLKIECFVGTQLFLKLYACTFDTIFSDGIMFCKSLSMALCLIYNPDNRSEAKNPAYLSWCYGYFDTKMN